MQIVSLNTFMGTMFGPVCEFVARLAPETDIFCFQEVMSDPGGVVIPADRHGVRANLLQELEVRLPDFVSLFAPVQDDYGAEPSPQGRVQLGVATFVRRGIDVVTSGDFWLRNGFNTYVAGDYATFGSNALHVTVCVKGGVLTICNLHGTSHPGNKLDTPERWEQSRRVLDFLQGVAGEKLVMGDFNLLPQTRSVGMFVEAGFRNLIKDYGIKTTRGTLMRQLHSEFANTPQGFQEFADYVFVTPGIKVQSFEVPDVPISDHLPMVLRCGV